jgi:hypothetical protein
MIRKAFILTLVIALFFFAGKKFYTDALRYDPLEKIILKKNEGREPVVNVVKLTPGWATDIHEKNLFSQTRTYLEPKPVVQSAATLVEPPRKPELSLKGIVLDNYGDYIAFVEIDQAKAMPLRRGDKVEGMEVLDISGKKLVLKWNNEIINMTIEKVRTLSQKPRTGK